MMLTQLAREVLAPLDAPAGYVRSEILGPDELDDDADVDEWLALDAAVAARAAAGGTRVVLRVVADELDAAWAVVAAAAGDGRGRIAFEAVTGGNDAAEAVARALDAGVVVRAVLADGATGIDCYRAAAAARFVLGTRVPIRVRWDRVLDVKGAALALTFGADELAGPLAPRRERARILSVGGPPEDPARPTPSYVEALIRAAGRAPFRRGGAR
jgi:hypothetical protein